MEEKLRAVVRLAPGILLLFAVGLAGKFLERTVNVYARQHVRAFPNIEYILWAILLGIILSNTIGVSRFFAPGVRTYEFFLKVGIVLLGARFLLGDVLRLGSLSLLLVVIEIAGSLLIMTWLGRWFGLNPKLTHLYAVGMGICGVSAIIATQGAIDADDEDASLAITTILTLGAVSLFAFPPIGHALHLPDKLFGLWAGLGVDNTAESVATGALYSDAAGKVATLVKSCRNAMIGPVVLGYAIYWANRGMAKQVENKGAFLWEKFPMFVLGFLAVSMLASLKAFNADQIKSLANASRWAFLMTFAGVGLKTNIRAMFRQGIQSFLVGAIGEAGIALLTLGLVVGGNRLFALQ
jgi:uncharacterized integral membrane protein (TIGR00698 family)